VEPRGFPSPSVDSLLVRVAVGPDHAGFDLEEVIRADLAAHRSLEGIA
jgi:hypothetical protein